MEELSQLLSLAKTLDSTIEIAGGAKVMQPDITSNLLKSRFILEVKLVFTLFRVSLAFLHISISFSVIIFLKWIAI